MTSPCALVKELIDNAIDAKATAIEVIVSSNTIDRISVKDNGTGIDMDDFSCLGRRAHTSKLRDLSELATIVSKTLGFRGEALASINSMADVVIITKKAGDPIAWRVELTQGTGGVKDKRPVSATVGTTVAATKLFENIPPRKQHCLSEKNKSMLGIQDILKATILSRPHIRMSLKIIGDSKPLWSYSPKPPLSNREAVLQLFGATVLENSIEINEKARSGPVQGNAFTSDEWSFSGRISIPSCGPDGRRRPGVYLAIDQRPMCSEWHVSKKMVGILRSKITTISGVRADAAQGDLFMHLNIQCPSASYDANIAAQKDEVAFSDEKVLLSMFERVCEKSLEKHRHALLLTDSTTSSKNQTWILTNGTEDNENGERNSAPGDKSSGTQSRQLTSNKMASSLPHHPCSSSDKIRTVLKTTFKVNMSIRDEEELSDDENHPGLTEVEIPPRGPFNRLGDCRRKQNILQYFRPAAKDEFQIACDSTATLADSLEVNCDSESTKSGPASRRPLQPLSASALNRIRDEADSGPEAPEEDLTVVSQTTSGLRARVQGLATRGLVTPSRELLPHGRGRDLDSLPTNSQSPEGHEERSPLMTASPRIPTPPRSNSRFRGSPSSFWPASHFSLNSVSPTRVDKRRCANSGQNSHIGKFRNASLQQSRGQSGPNNASYKRSFQGIGVSRESEPAHQRCLFTRGSNMLSQAIKRMESEDIDEHHAEADQMFRSVPEWPLGTGVIASQETQPWRLNSPREPSRDVQNPLGCRPSAPLTKNSSNPGDGCRRSADDADDAYDAYDADIRVIQTEAVSANTCFRPALPVARESCSGENETSRFDASAGLYHWTTTLACGQDDIRQRTNEHAKLEAYISHGKLSFARDSRTVLLAHGQLERCVNSWLERNDMSGQIYYYHHGDHGLKWRD
ncbi:uncharacterized protein UV8b_02399 [Ustilaginoidea virens]|uniref:DNA mismatch repair protein S5 domain-containing protein n=1 Tax=Ustilaginoidea virens TaxID=1159556 RepID=A0A8E5HMS5_USTVR|nr:uncharacterized protein UV8b_02399 [Ustilaginoidea virens]QUC18158.1 hypothetical protein UV8b_02399 [Ustilaginoidea virens]